MKTAIIDLMTEEIQLNEEKKSDNPNIRLVPTVHHPKYIEGRKLWPESAWVKAGKTNPNIIAFDSLPSINSNRYIIDHLPENLRLLNRTSEEIYVVGGDIGNTPPLVGETRRKALRENIRTRQVEDLATFAIGSIICNSIYSAVEKQNNESDDINTLTISRRNFLKLAGGAAITATPIVRVASRMGAAFTQNPKTEELLVKIANISSYYLKDSKWFIDGRTALLAAKTQDAIDEIGLPHDTSGTLVMGTAHIQSSKEILGNNERRNQEIRIFARNVIEIMDRTLEENGMTNIRESAKEFLLAGLSGMEINKIPISENNSDTTWKQNIQTRMINSQQVQSALNGL